MIRTRDNSKTLQTFETTQVKRRLSDDSQVSATNYGLSYRYRTNVITDELLPKSDVRTRTCLHSSYRYNDGPYSFTMWQPGSGDYYVYTNHWDMADLDQYIVSFEDKDRLGSTTPGHILGLYGFNARAFEAMKPSLEQDVSLTNFLLELSDLRLLMRFFAPSSDILKKISEGHLTWSFGVKPMISDLSEIYNSIFNYEKRIKDFLDRRNTPQKRYYSESDDLSDPENPDWQFGDTWYACHVTTERLKIKRTATMSYSYDCDDIESLLDELQALRGILGLKFTPSVVWEAIPYSFVVDWFLNVGKFLESRESDVIEPTVFITDYSISHKVQFSYLGHFSWYDNTGAWYDKQIVATCYGTVYRRNREIPDTDGVPLQLSLLSSNQLALAASLINVRR